MGKKLTTNSFSKRLLDKNIELMSEYDGLGNEVKCKCHCGKIFNVRAHTILYRSKSCGCGMYQYNKGKDSYLWKGIGDISSRTWHGIKTNAKNRKIEFSITLEDIWELFLKQNKRCYYTNLPLIFSDCSKNASDKTASLDRIDSNKGYIKGNIRWIHKYINFMKWDMTEDYFIYLCQLICKPIINNNDNDSCIIFRKNNNFQGYMNIGMSYWTSIIKRCKRKELDISVTIEDIWKLFLKQKGYCRLTGMPIQFGYKSKQTASLDRIDSNKGYIKGNIQWIHKDVNRKLKREMKEDVMIKYCGYVKDNYENKKN